MKSNLYKFNNTSSYLKHIAQNQNKPNRGMQSRLAEAAGCSKPHFSLVMKERAFLTPDQAYGVCQYLGLSKMEQKYFELILSHERASNKKYKDYLKQEIKKYKIKATKLIHKTENNNPTELSSEDLFLYYSDWIYSAVHIATSIPHYQSIKKLKSFFHLDSKKINEIIDYLNKIKLIKQDGDSVKISNNNMHLDKESKYYKIFSKQWSDKIHELQKNKNLDDFDYTGCFTCDEDAYEQIREEFDHLFEKIQKIVQKSSERKMAVIKINLSNLI